MASSERQNLNFRKFSEKSHFLKLFQNWSNVVGFFEEKKLFSERNGLFSASDQNTMHRIVVVDGMFRVQLRKRTEAARLAERMRPRGPRWVLDQAPSQAPGHWK